jgi:hypothetical protein
MAVPGCDHLPGQCPEEGNRGIRDRNAGAVLGAQNPAGHRGRKFIHGRLVAVVPAGHPDPGAVDVPRRSEHDLVLITGSVAGPWNAGDRDQLSGGVVPGLDRVQEPAGTGLAGVVRPQLLLRRRQCGGGRAARRAGLRGEGPQQPGVVGPAPQVGLQPDMPPRTGFPSRREGIAPRRRRVRGRRGGGASRCGDALGAWRRSPGGRRPGACGYAEGAGPRRCWRSRRRVPRRPCRRLADPRSCGVRPAGGPGRCHSACRWWRTGLCRRPVRSEHRRRGRWGRRWRVLASGAGVRAA